MDFKTKQFLDMSEVLDQVGTTVRVERRQISPTGKIGVNTEISNYAFIRNIMVYIESKKTGYADKLSTDAGTGMKYSFLGITTDDDVKIGDKWVDDNRSYMVVFADRSHVGKSEVGLEVFE
jgi:hypothetical protein